jgi:hypothetical protein
MLAIVRNMKQHPASECQDFIYLSFEVSILISTLASLGPFMEYDTLRVTTLYNILYSIGVNALTLKHFKRLTE